MPLCKHVKFEGEVRKIMKIQDIQDRAVPEKEVSNCK
jgi:hypothetical protein